MTIVTTEGEQRVLSNLQRKARQCDEMFTSLVANANNALRIDVGWKFNRVEELPVWLKPNKRRGSTNAGAAAVVDMPGQNGRAAHGAGSV